MTEVFAKVVKVNVVEDAKNSDRLSSVQCLGWWVISSKIPQLAMFKDTPTEVYSHKYKPGDEVIFIEVDSILDEKFISYFFKDSKIAPDSLQSHRIRSIKIRSVVSQGIILDTTDPELLELYPELKKVKLGDDVSNILGIKKYEPPVRSIPKGMQAKGTNKKHPQFKEYSDLDNFRRYPDVFEDGEEIVITLKAHGCLQKNTPIVLADGSTKTIGEIVDNRLSVELLGMDKAGNIIPTKILNWFNNGKTKKWLNVKISGISSNNPYSKLICTDNHKFWVVDRGYIEASNLEIGDKVISPIVTKIPLEMRGLEVKSKIPEGYKLKYLHRVGEIIEVSRHITTDHRINTCRYDIETETHNFFANWTLVHNSNHRVAKLSAIPYTFWHKIKKFFGLFPKFETLIGSRRVQISRHKNYKGFYDEDIYTKVAVKEGILDKLEPGVAIYSEVIGPGIQANFDYGLKEHKLITFDIMRDGIYLDYDDFVAYCEKYNLSRAPELYRGPYSEEIVHRVRNENNHEMDKKVPCREGIVFKSVKESNHPSCGRRVLKAISDKFYLLKDSSDFH